MKIYRAFLGLGSNIGERHEFLNRAAKKLVSVPGTRLVWASSVYESDPVGKTDQPKFLNAVIEIETALKPEELVLHTQRIEEETGRTPGERWGPREIDIDILLYDGLVYAGDGLKVPHPELENRRFVLVPFRELAPDVVHPVSGLTIEELSEQARDGSRIVKTAHRVLI